MANDQLPPDFEFALEDVIDVNRIQKLLDLLYDIASVPSSIIDLDGRILTGSGWKEVCLEVHRKVPGMLNNCLESDIHLANQMLARKPLALYKCKNGLIDGAAPIIIQGRHMANIFTGQFFISPPDLEYFRERARAFGLDEKDYVAKIQALPVFPRAKVQQMLQFLAQFAEFLGELGLNQLRLRRTTRLLKDAQEVRLRQQKIESLSLLAGGIAHDFNNILVGVLGNVELLRTSDVAREEPELAQIVDSIEDAAFQAKRLSNQLLTFSKGGAPVKKPLYVNDLVREAISLTSRGANSKVEVTLLEEPLACDVDPGQVQQALSNVLINAFQAMPGGGIVELHLEPVEIFTTKRLPLEKGQYVRIAIKDHGTGIPAEIQSKVFDPYFSTKPEGNGLGLATTYSIVKRHGGYVDFTTVEGEGTTFVIYLPTTSKQPKMVPVSGDAAKKYEGRALVLDDEYTVRRILSRMLSRAGFLVDTAVDGDQALRKARFALISDAPYVLVIADLTIPGGMGGRELVPHLRELDPGIKIVVSSGYSTDPVMSHFRDYGFDGVLQKPYTIADLNEVLDRVMGAPTPGSTLARESSSTNCE